MVEQELTKKWVDALIDKTLRGSQAWQYCDEEKKLVQTYVAPIGYVMIKFTENSPEQMRGFASLITHTFHLLVESPMIILPPMEVFSMTTTYLDKKNDEVPLGDLYFLACASIELTQRFNVLKAFHEAIMKP